MEAQRIYVVNNIDESVDDINTLIDPIGPNLSDVISKGVISNGNSATQNTSQLTNSMNDNKKSPLEIIKNPYVIMGFLGLLLIIASKKR